MIEILVGIAYFIIHITAYAIWDAYGTQYPFLITPQYIYNKYKVNWFGAIFLYLLYIMTTPIFAIVSILWWLCIIGRK